MITFIDKFNIPLHIGLACVVCIGALRMYTLKIFGMCESKNKLHGKTVIITGANTGIGKETAIDLARRGAKVILACRNVEKAECTRVQIIEETGNENIIVRELDLASLSSVRKFATGVLESESRLDVLINNAGYAGREEKKLTEDGLEYKMQTNYFGHFLLTNLLLGLLKKTAPSRVINVSSLAHAWAKDLDMANLNSEINYNPAQTYYTSKLCQIYFTRYLAPLIINSGVTVNSLNPGVVKTEIFRQKTLRNFLLTYFVLPFFKTAKEGAQTSIYLAVADEVAGVTGEYFSDCKVCKPSKSAINDRVAKNLWEVSEVLVKLNSKERQF